jgi:hypothetical protein
VNFCSSFKLSYCVRTVISVSDKKSFRRIKGRCPYGRGELFKGVSQVTERNAISVQLACERIEQVAAEILLAIQPELARRPAHPNDFYLALNTLAFVVARLVVAADGRGRQFFEQAVTENITALKRGHLA